MRSIIKLFHWVLLGSVALVMGCGSPSLMVTPVWHSNDLQEIEVERGQGFSRPKIAIVEVEGMLINARSSGLLSAGENKLSLFVQEMERAERDPAVKAVVLRINSPGGTVTCSDTMYEIVRRFKAKTGKPVIASTQEVAASGAYYIACASDTIVVHPTSVVGSIGVIFNTFNFEGTMGKLGVRADAIKSGTMKDMGSPFKTVTAEERKLMQEMVDEYYARFVNVVTTHRKVTDPATAMDGRVFSGEAAVKMGLADRTGLLSDAIALARDAAKAPNASAVLYRRPAGYSGSIYADVSTPSPQANVLRLDLPDAASLLPRGFYYLWQQ